MREFYRIEDGQGMVEYGLIIALIVLVVLALFPPLGRWVSSKLDIASNALTTTQGG